MVQEEKKLHLHNLGQYILSREAPKFSKNRKDVALLLIELELPRTLTVAPIGVDYLKLGPVHFSVFSKLSYLLSYNELESLKNSVIQSIRKASNLLAIVEEFPTGSISKNFTKFYESYRQAISALPILGYFLFEVLSEYIALFQTGDEVERYKELGELYCANFKNIIYSVCPDLTRSFNLGLFHPHYADVLKYLHRIKIVRGARKLSSSVT